MLFIQLIECFIREHTTPWIKIIFKPKPWEILYLSYIPKPLYLSRGIFQTQRMFEVVTRITIGKHVVISMALLESEEKTFKRFQTSLFLNLHNQNIKKL